MNTALKIFQNHYQADPVTNEVNSIALNSKFFTVQDAIKALYYLIGEDEPIFLQSSDYVEHLAILEVLSFIRNYGNGKEAPLIDKVTTNYVQLVRRVAEKYSYMKIPQYDPAKHLDFFKVLDARIQEGSFAVQPIMKSEFVLDRFPSLPEGFSESEAIEKLSPERIHHLFSISPWRTAGMNVDIPFVDKVRFLKGQTRYQYQQEFKSIMLYFGNPILYDSFDLPSHVQIELPVRHTAEVHSKIKQLQEFLKENLSCLTLYRGFAVYCTERSTDFKENGILHNTKGPARIWDSGLKHYMINGKTVPSVIVDNPEGMTKSMIDYEDNAETRAIMMQLFTSERYFKESKVELVNTWFLPLVYQDHTGWIEAARKMNITPHLGRLYKDVVNHNFFVECLNSTPNPDGTLNVYYLRVPPCKTAREAIAWTFGLKETEYNPVMMS